MNPRLSEILDRRMAERVARAAENRRQFPTVATLVDEMVQQFGPVKVRAGIEPDGRSFGAFGPGPDEVLVQPVLTPPRKTARRRK